MGCSDDGLLARFSAWPHIIEKSYSADAGGFPESARGLGMSLRRYSRFSHAVNASNEPVERIIGLVGIIDEQVARECSQREPKRSNLYGDDRKFGLLSHSERSLVGEIIETETVGTG
jgi:hypothetical protein